MKKVLILCPLILFSCSSYEKTDEKIQEELISLAVSEVHAAKYPKVAGTVSFENVSEGIKVKASLSGLPKKTNLGFHIHQVGACEGPDYKSAGDHFNPTNAIHGGSGHSTRHFGDLGNLVTDANGEARYEMIIPKTSDADFEQIIGKAVLIHAKKDDLKSQPSGNSGARIACGIIKPLESIKKVAEQGTMSTDQNETSSSEASISGTTDDKIDLRDEEVQLQEEKSHQELPFELNESELKDDEEEMEN